MRIIKYTGATFGIIVLLYLFVINFSSVATNYECRGVIGPDENKQPLTVYIVLETYRWWVGIWSESDGNLQLEIPNELTNYYSHIDKIGNNLFLYEYPKEMKGTFSTLSKVLSLKTPYGFFDGKCKTIQ